MLLYKLLANNVYFVLPIYKSLFQPNYIGKKINFSHVVYVYSQRLKS